ncbi:MAG: hypothetical protein RLZZ450_5262 [Pseudomonadota bacterium]|jgi:hypothetical protein
MTTKNVWQLVRELGLDLADDLALARGDARQEHARQAVHKARLALEAETGDDEAAVRTLFAALEAAYRQVGP